MLTYRSPFRISYFGGGTDFPEWFLKNNKGLVLSTTINKYCYVFLRALPPFFDFKYRLRYFKTETVKDIGNIKHLAIKNVLRKYHTLKTGLEIIHYADLPALSGLAASSSFTNALIGAVNSFNGRKISKKDMAEKSIFLEKKILKNNCGLQDQYATAFGGFNEIIFKKKIKIKKLLINSEKKKLLNDNTLIFYTGISRKAENIEKKKIKEIEKNLNYYERIYNLTLEAKKILLDKKNENFLKYIGELMKESWELKKNLTSKVSNSYLDNIYNLGLENGALGGKVLGAGGGGFIMFLTKNSSQKKKLINSFHKLIHVDFKFENSGTKIFK